MSALQLTAGATDAEALPQAPLVCPEHKADTPGRRRRRGRPAQHAPAEVETPIEPEPVTEPATEPAPEPVQKSDLCEKVLAKPPVRKLAKDHGLDLSTITPTGQHGEVTRSEERRVGRG